VSVGVVVFVYDQHLCLFCHLFSVYSPPATPPPTPNWRAICISMHFKICIAGGKKKNREKLTKNEARNKYFSLLGECSLHFPFFFGYCFFMCLAVSWRGVGLLAEISMHMERRAAGYVATPARKIQVPDPSPHSTLSAYCIFCCFTLLHI